MSYRGYQCDPAHPPPVACRKYSPSASSHLEKIEKRFI